MTFETAKVVSLVLHYLVVLSAAALFILRKPTILRAFVRTYIAVFFWIGITFLFNGCPITHFENWLSAKIYQQEFYPSYSFTDSDARQFLEHWDLLFPLVLVLLIWLIFPGFRTVR